MSKKMCNACGKHDMSDMMARITVEPPQFVPIGNQVFYMCFDCVRDMSMRVESGELPQMHGEPETDSPIETSH